MIRSALVASLFVSTFAFAAEPAAPHAAADAHPPASSGIFSAAPKVGKVSFVEPKDGATVPQEFTVKFKVEGMKIHPAGSLESGTGHHHLLVDTDAVKEGDVIPTDDKHLHFGKGQTETKVKLAPGKHSLTLQFADGAHRSYGPALSKTIHVTVK